MSDIQALFDGWAAQSRLERIESESIMNLGDLIEQFRGMALCQAARGVQARSPVASRCFRPCYERLNGLLFGVCDETAGENNHGIEPGAVG